MTYTDDHYYLTWGGTFAGVETWQTGQRFCPTPATPVANAGFLLDQLSSISMSDILGDLQAVMTRLPTQFHTKVFLSWAKLAVIKEDGRYAGDPVVYEGTPVGGTGGSGIQFPQLAWCVSMWSGSGFGHANRGRQYWPCPSNAYPQEADGLVITSACQAFAASVRLAMDAVNGEIATVAVDVRPCIMSKIGTGTTKVVNRVGVGGAVDTIRSRREALDDTPKTWQGGWAW